MTITLPPLRDRRDDIPALAHFFLQRFAAETKKPFQTLAPEVRARLLAYPWPGNVRELANVIKRAVVLGEGPEIILQELSPMLVEAPPPLVAPSRTTQTYPAALEACRRDLLRQALTEAQGNHTAAAQALGLQRTYFQRLLKSLGLS